jgi:hypothetical protein
MSTKFKIVQIHFFVSPVPRAPANATAVALATTTTRRRRAAAAEKIKQKPP